MILNSPKHGLDGPVLWYCGTPFQTQKARHGRKRDSWEGYPPPTAKDADKYERRELAWTNFNHGRDIPRLKKTVEYFTEFAKKGRIQIVREQGGKKEIIPIDYNLILNGESPAQDIYLQPGDTIIVP